MSIIGQTISAIIVEESERFYFIQKGEDLLRLDKTEGEHAIGDVVTGFVYVDKDEHRRLTTLEQKATNEQYGWGTVTAVRKDLGAFVDTGLPGKDVVVSLDDLPLEKDQWPKVGDQLYVKLIVDRKERIWGHLAWHEDFWNLAGPGYDNMQNQDLRAIVYRNKESGTFVYLPDNNMLGFIHPNERFSVPRVGQELQVRVIGFRKEDRSLNLSAKPRAYEMLDADSQMILAYLQSMGGKMAFNDKSNPDEIKATFGISKGQFKKALGGLMKAKKIKQSPEGTELIGE
ncbi:RNA binding domain protein [Lactococcus cremoris subsp. cremoris UC509.9]|uniref:S1 RNA-binding domain-containing protein n=1 Tax=Lactococcus lactis subsp. cremoris TaxID=1359 RepID=A0AAJ6MJC0_LACLC|nr:S1 RNA-binding domain-containing protein [Lactococcus cremoris]AFW92408.1 RNA binding domain protein [Lactococcus cremoris subsp. cremoris UC509.9]ARD92154.1 S1 RNA-binding domain-containing protein [Lactococcus cremoris]MRM69210.1 RNA-binding protein [Lactococcus cremoris]QJD18804.1 S1 RNA-binding domain-containing protein [Lactococcus cremoris]QRZ30683.1 RNA binding domain protein [Lactococcus cremoris]